MDILKLATDWARSEVFSTKFFILFGFVFIAGAIGFWQLGKTDIARAYIVPLLVCGTLLVIIGGGLLYTNMMRIGAFTEAYNADVVTFVESEFVRIDSTLKEYQNVVFTAIPIIISVVALIMLFFQTPTVRAICVSVIAMLSVILLVDGTAHGRIAEYGETLTEQWEMKAAELD